MSNFSLVDLAAGIARVAHEGQARVGGEPYINHPERVADAVRKHGEHYAAAGWLHDVVEDSDWTLAALSAAGFPDDVVNAVDSVTRRPDETYMQMIDRACADPIGRVVKLADNADNTATLGEMDDDRRKFQEKRYARARAVLMAAEHLDAAALR